MNFIAFLGTGECDPNKGLKQLLLTAGTVLGWIVIIYLIIVISHSSKPKALKIVSSALLIMAGVIGTFLAFLVLWIGLACSPR